MRKPKCLGLSRNESASVVAREKRKDTILHKLSAHLIDDAVLSKFTYSRMFYFTLRNKMFPSSWLPAKQKPSLKVFSNMQHQHIGMDTIPTSMPTSIMSRMASFESETCLQNAGKWSLSISFIVRLGWWS
jgi:hypothetical protein